MGEYEVHAPGSVAEAARLLGTLGDDARAIAGGTALVLALRQRLLMPAHLVSIAGIAALCGIAWDPARGLRIGALARHDEIARSASVRTHYPMLATLAAQMANPQVRNQGTLGGNLCYGDPATDPPGCLLALDASVVLGSARGERVLPLAEFLVDFYTTALEPDELLVEVRLPPPAADSDGRYTRWRRTAAEHRPLVNVSVHVRRDVQGDGRRCSAARIVVGASTPVARRIARAEACLVDGEVDAARVAEVAAIVASDIDAISDARGDAAYRRRIARVATQRTLQELFGLAAG